jgi:hypothetical protein
VRGKLLDSGDPAFRDWLSGGDSSSEIQDLRRRRLAAQVRNEELELAEREGELIGRRFVRQHVIGLLEELFRRLLYDGARTIAIRTAGAARSGSTDEELTALVRGIISAELTATRDRVVRNIRGAEAIHAEREAPS